MSSRETCGRRILLGTVAAAWWLGTCSPGWAQESIHVGEVVPRVQALADEGQSYALYLPSAYDGARSWPLLILMDPRGRALAPLDGAVSAAERLGFIVASSYNTASDGPAEPNVDALNALLADVPARWSVNTDRVYLVGFSGTARFAWEAAQRLSGHIPGVVGFGAGPSADAPMATTLLATRGRPFDYFGGVGESDFNFHEVLSLESRLRELDLPHRFAFFPGGHGWPPPALIARAVEWLEVRAVARGLAARSSSWVDSVYADWKQEAGALEAQGRPFEAWREYRALEGDFAELRDVNDVAARVADLGTTPAVREALEALEQSRRRQEEWEGRYRQVSQRVGREPMPDLEDVLDELDVPALTASDGDAGAAASRARILELLFVRASFYEARRYMAADDLDRALLMNQVAQAVKPSHPGVALARAGLLARLGRLELAFEALERFAASPAATRSPLESDPMLDPLRADPRFAAILERLRKPR